MPFRNSAFFLTACCLVSLIMPTRQARAAGGELRITVVDRDTGKPIACRMHLKNAKGVAQQAPKMPFFKDHFVFPGKITLKLPKGSYTFELERGPEYAVRTGHFTIEDFADDEKTIDLHRAVNMADEGWWSGDLHIHRPVKDIELLMEAEDLHIAPVITWWHERRTWEGKQPPTKPLVKFAGNRYYQLLAGEDERSGGALLFFNLDTPLETAAGMTEYPPMMDFVLAARKQPKAWIDVEKPFWWDVPIWLASGKVDSIGVANNHMCREQMYAKDEAWGKPRDKSRFPGPVGNGQWTQEIYYHALNCGLRIPPSAGSASGVLPNPVGYNRMYVWVDKDDFNYDSWWEAFRLGRVLVTNGPLLRPLAENRMPGHVFKGAAGEELSIEITANLSTRDTIDYLEVIQDGRVAHSVRLDDWAKANGHFPPVKFHKSGWFMVRAVTTNPKTYRFAASAPWYVEIGEQPRISKQSAKFFLDWVNERTAGLKLENPSQRAEVLKYHDMARTYWQDLVSKANAD